MKTNSRRKYDSDFKRNAVKLCEDRNRTVPEVANNLGINSDLIYRWRKDLCEKGAIAFPGNGIPALTDEQKRIKELQKQLRNTEMERDILKKAVGIFSKGPK